MNELMHLEQTLHPEDSQKNFYFPFTVSSDATRLTIDYSYDPKYLADEAEADRLLDEGFSRYIGFDEREKFEAMRASFKPLVNLLTISLDSPCGYMGAAHRHAPEQHHTIGIEESSPGFLRGQLPPGQWSVCLSAHAVVTAQCRVTIIVREETL